MKTVGIEHIKLNDLANNYIVKQYIIAKRSSNYRHSDDDITEYSSKRRRFEHYIEHHFERRFNSIDKCKSYIKLYVHPPGVVYGPSGLITTKIEIYLNDNLISSTEKGNECFENFYV